ncbi:MAG: hypothetical protein M3350_02605 [Actinomycetota bacterium]|nr:hypothetical protein [Actinomycetota bacterium]
MANVGIVVLADGESPESLGRVVNALLVAREHMDAGDGVTTVFDGAGTKAAASFADASHDYHEIFAAVQGTVAGACDYCAGAFGVKDEVEKLGITLLDEYRGHPSVKKLIDQGYEIVTF